MIINKDKAYKDGVMTPDAHEFFHGMLWSTLQSDVQTQMAFGNAVKDEINVGIDSGYIKVDKNS